jgi:hypothetical protein
MHLFLTLKIKKNLKFKYIYFFIEQKIPNLVFFLINKNEIKIFYVVIYNQLLYLIKLACRATATHVFLLLY